MKAMLKGAQESLELGSTTMGIGRSPENQLVLNTSEVSWFHAQIGQNGQGYYVVDLGSSNGTYVNGHKVSRNAFHHLNDGDIIRFGNLAFRYLCDTAQQASVRPVAQNGIPVRAKTAKKKTPGWITIAAGIASLATIFATIWGVYIYLHPTHSVLTPTPTLSPSIPLLHPSYGGSYTRNDGKISKLTLSSLTEEADGNFSATGNDGNCPAQFSGTVRADNTIDFTLDEALVVNCGFAGEFQGQIYPDGHLAGQWQGARSQISGSWTVS